MPDIINRSEVPASTAEASFAGIAGNLGHTSMGSVGNAVAYDTDVRTEYDDARHFFSVVDPAPAYYAGQAAMNLNGSSREHTQALDRERDRVAAARRISRGLLF